MPRIAGIDIPADKPAWVSLTYIYGIGTTVSREILKKADIDPSVRAKDLTEAQVTRIAQIIDNEYMIEGQLRRQVAQNITRMKKIQCYRGIRHIRGLPTRGQRTKTNARTRKGKKKTVANKKKAGI
ncbi:MAG: 30S ribosomal protein S13 [Planctomycetota bacterium]|nr:30S ribosomal protein S13 [Planctomycetota bacterium]